MLYVDDETVNRNVGRRLLQKLGCGTVVVREDGCEVQGCMEEAGRERAFHVLMLDIQMRQVNGDVVCKSLRAQGVTDLPIIALTGALNSSMAGTYSPEFVVGS